MPQFDEQLPNIAFPANLDEIIIHSDNTDPLTFAVKIDGTTVMQTTLCPDNEQTIIVSDLAEFLSVNLRHNHISEVGIWLDGVLADGTILIPSKIDIDSDAETFCEKHFLSLVKGAKTTYIGGNEFLSFYSATAVTPAITCLWVNPDTGDVQQSAGTVAMIINHGANLYTIRFEPGNFVCPSEGFILHSFTVNAGEREQDYVICTPIDCDPFSMLFINNFGVRETFHCFGTMEKELKPTRNTTSFSGKTRNYKVEAIPTWKCETGILSEAVQPLFADLCATTKAWREDNGREITITENEHKISNDRYEIQRGTVTFRESNRNTLHKPLEHENTFDQTFDNTFD